MQSISKYYDEYPAMLTAVKNNCEHIPKELMNLDGALGGLFEFISTEQLTQPQVNNLMLICTILWSERDKDEADSDESTLGKPVK